MDYETALFIIIVIWFLMPKSCEKPEKRNPKPLDDMDYTFLSPEQIEHHYRD